MLLISSNTPGQRDARLHVDRERLVREPRAEVYPYRPSRLFVWANALSPTLVDKIMTRFFRERIQARANAST